MKRTIEIAMAAWGLVAILSALSPSVHAAEYRLGVSDRVKIKVQEWPDITGEYTVTADGTVSLPLIGNINAVGLRPSKLGQNISDRFKERSGGADVLTAVEVSQYRPFAIMGDVQRPGQYPYRPGLTVLEAISIAGGYYRPELGLLRLGREIAVASGEVNTQIGKLNRLIVHEARLSAALAGRDNFALPPELSKQKDDPEIFATLKNEQAALSLEHEMKQNELASMEAIKLLYQQEIETLNGQVQALAEEKDSIGTQLKQLRSMAAKGLALSPTLFALERSHAQVVNQQMSAGTAIVKANESIAVSEQRVTQFQQERNRLNSKELQQTRELIAETREKIETANVLLDEAQNGAPAEARRLASHDLERPEFTVFRRDGETVRQFGADEASLVAPDDVIKIPTARTRRGFEQLQSRSRVELPGARQRTNQGF